MLYALKAAGIPAEGFPDAAGFWARMQEETPDLILLDIMLPDEDGLSVLRALRAGAATSGIPVIMASAKGTEYDKVIGLDLGADDYLAKPFGMLEMVSRVRAVLRRTGKQEEERTLRMGGIEMDLLSHRVSVNGRAVELTRKEYDLLHLFLTHVGKAFSRDMLLSEVWGSDYAGETRTVDVHVGSLRTKLGSEAAWIRTVRGVGYRMEDRS